ncbi:hypothetical protein EC844_1144 [Acinetobacter calcoaceticus]|uniref:DUF4760 domain-containing protein n=1 Tax=Acinetobacter calcoaceticus TaxID=471 RepID=A0A4R1XNL3_ACICA|nr:hypothetical protein EC844_1144 [Acinetobacter calcoaceticus]
MSYEDIFTLIVDLCTIAAFVVAFIAWKNWKKQQNYTLVLDKIFEFEIALNAYFNLELALIDIEIEHVNQYHQNSKIFRWPFFFTVDRFKNKFRYKFIENKIHSYNLALSTLEILEVQFDATKLRNAAYYEHEISKLYKVVDQSCTPDEFASNCKLIHVYIQEQFEIAHTEVKRIQKKI